MSAAELVVSLLTLIAAVAPGVLAAATGLGSDKLAIADMVRRVEALAVRGGSEGADAEDLERRKRGE